MQVLNWYIVTLVSSLFVDINLPQFSNMSMSLISNCTFVLYFDEDLIQRIFMKPQDKLLLMYRHVTMMHQQYTCIKFYLVK